MASHTDNPISASRPGSASTTELDPCMVLAAKLATQLASQWQRGIACSADDVLAEYPRLLRHARAAICVISEEIYQRLYRGQQVTRAELQRRFPQWAESLITILDEWRDRPEELTDAVASVSLRERRRRRPHFPEIGDKLGEFRILGELGRGAVSRVYLAHQAFLAGRLMVLKVTQSGVEEHLTLARLQHTQIVPLYSVRDFPDRNLRCLCMPCLGGATLRQLLQTLHATPPARRRGQHLLDALPVSASDPRLFWDSHGPNRRFLERASYVQAVCWIGVCLAEGLQYAHEQGLVHLDIKPPNVLLTADLQPMLLDFHLARGPIRPHDERPVELGGTTGYMSPEQGAAIRATREGTAIPGPVDGRSDIYSLGLVLFELLAGSKPHTDNESISLPPRTDLSVGLRDIVARCLYADPQIRYPNAAALAEDLRRYLTDRPLLGVRNRSLAERWCKWRRRQPHTLLFSLLVALCLSAVSAMVWLHMLASAEHRQQAEQSLSDGLSQVHAHRFEDALQTFRRGLEHVGGPRDDDPLAAELERGRRRAIRELDVADVHRDIERARYLHCDDALAPAMLVEAQGRCRAAWQRRGRLFVAADPLDPATEETLRRDLLDAAVLWVDWQVRRAIPQQAVEARREALAVLAEAETMLGPSPVLSLQRLALCRALGHPEPGEEAPLPRTAWEHYMLGRWLLRCDDIAGAAKAFDQAVASQPQDFWPWFGKGLCAYRQERLQEAAAAFTVCIALSPNTAECHYNRALVLVGRGDRVGALQDYNRALTLNPSLAAAALNRGALHVQERRFPEAVADLQLALTLGANPAAVHYNRALVHHACREPDAALAAIERALQHDPEFGPAQELRARIKKSSGPGKSPSG
jgi:serine/threonine protein kinase/Flp pilus assembly protein TadD